MNEAVGLDKALNDGDSVVLSTGVTATVRGAYPKGYRGDVRILLNGVEELERADGFLVTRPEPFAGDELDVAERSGDEKPSGDALARAPQRRMKD